MGITPKSKVGVALATYEPDGAMLTAQLQSLIDQTHTRWVCHITCDSPVLPLFTEEPRILWHMNPSRLGHARNFERALQLCASDPDVGAIAFCDQDDIWMPQKLEKSLALLGRCPPLSLVHCDLTPFGEGVTGTETLWSLERRVVDGAMPLTEMIRCTVNATAALFDAELARRFPSFPEGVGHHDQWLAVLAAAHGGIHPLPESLVMYRQHGKNVSGINPYRGAFSIPSSPIERIARRSAEFRQLQGAFKAAGLEHRDHGNLAVFRVVLKSFATDPVLSRAAFVKLLGSTLPLRRGQS
jgi:hypothetical protein